MPIVISGTNGISGVDGTASNPSYEGTDANTGVFFPAADTVAIATGGSERVRVDSSGNVGFGTSSPQTFGTFTWLTITGKSTTTGGAIELRTSDSSTVGYTNLANSAWQFVTNTNHPIAFQTNNTERMRILTTGNILSLSGGSTTATGTGIAFPATQSASSDANTLDDYEEGTFTPTLSFGGGSTGLVYGSQGGFYTKIGNQVTVNVTITLSNKGSSTGGASIGGLPFTVSATSLNNPISVVQSDFLTFGTGYVAYYAPNNNTIFNPYLISSGSVGTQLTNTAFANNTTIRATFSYFV